MPFPILPPEVPREPSIATKRHCAERKRYRVRLRGGRITATSITATPASVGHIHEVVTIGGKELAKVGFDDRKIVYYLLEDLELDERGKRGTFHDVAPERPADD